MKKQSVQLGVLTYMGLEARVEKVEPLKNDPSYWYVNVWVDNRPHGFPDTESALAWLEQEAMLRRQGLRAALLSALGGQSA
jgi:hypothetical protein